MPATAKTKEPPWILMVVMSIAGTVAAGLILDELRIRRGRTAMMCPTGSKPTSPDV